ncbi:MAG: glycosyltransferase [Kiritimatiellia bacterium]
MNILHVVPTYDLSGRSRLIHELCQTLASPDFNFTIACLSAAGNYSQRDVPVVWLGKREGFDVGAARRLAGVIRERNIAILHSHGGRAVPYVALASGLCGRRPLLHTVHRADGDPVATNQFKARMVLAAVNLVVGVSEAARRAFCVTNNFPPDKTVTIYNGIALNRFLPSAPARGTSPPFLPTGRPVIGTVANLSYDKDHVLLVRAFATILPQWPAARLVIAGDGPVAPAIRELAQQLGVAERVDFLGYRSDVPELLRLFDVFVYPTATEGFGLAVVEAMAAGVPVLACSVGAIPELMEHEISGLLFAPGNVEELRQGIIRLLTDDVLRQRLVSAAHATVAARFTLERMVEAYADVYQRLAASA